MDWKNKCADLWEKAKKYWAVFLVACGKAWKWTCKFAADARVWLRKAWNVTNVWLTKAKVWVQKALKFLGKYSKLLLGWMAVLALKIRKWIMKTTPRLKSWWDQWKVRKWLAAKTEQIREKFPAPAEEEPAQIAAAAEPEKIQEEPAAPAPVAAPAPAPAPEPEPVRVQAPPARPVVRRRKLGPVATALLAIWKAISGTCIWIYRLRKYIMAAPVAFYAVKLAIANANRLPDTVGLDIQASGEFARMVSRQHAVLGPLGVTVFCLVLVLCSRKPLLPWLISIFTLILPILIWMTNYYA